MTLSAGSRVVGGSHDLSRAPTGARAHRLTTRDYPPPEDRRKLADDDAARARARAAKTNRDPERCPRLTCDGCPSKWRCICPPCACDECQRRTQRAGRVQTAMRSRAQTPIQERLFDPVPDPVREAARR